MNPRHTPLPFHCLLFAIFPFLFLTSINVGELPIAQLLVPCLISLGISALALGGGFLVLRDLKQAACCVALLQFLFWSYGHAYFYMGQAIGSILGRHRYLVACYIVVSLGVLFLLHRKRKDLARVTQWLNMLSVLLVLISFLNIGISLTDGSLTTGPPAGSEATGPAAETSSQGVLKYSKAGPLPDVYYIIFDGYTSAESLQHFFDFDNKEFLEALKEKGFEVTSDAHSNYMYTKDSLSSTLNMSFIDWDKSLRGKMLHDNQVTKNFKALGYKSILFASNDFTATKFTSVDILFQGGFFEKEIGLIIRQTTALWLYFEFVGDLRRERLFTKFDNVAALADDPDPTFTYAHFDMPHPPYMLDRNGEPPAISTRVSMTDWEPKEMYLDQLIFINKKLMELVQELLTRSSQPPIIIVQGDHGPKFELDSGTEYAYKILNAAYLPGLDGNLFHEGITPVNTFRVLFNEYFGGQYPLLEDRASIPPPWPKTDGGFIQRQLQP